VVSRWAPTSRCRWPPRPPNGVRGLLVEMPVLEWAVPGAALVFLPMLLGVHYAAPLARIVAWLARRVPRTTIGPVDSVVGTLSLDPEETTAVLHGMLAGPITPTYEERHAIAAPALVIGHKIDFIHPFNDADHLARQLPLARLVEARSVIELRFAPSASPPTSPSSSTRSGITASSRSSPARWPCRPKPEGRPKPANAAGTGQAGSAGPGRCPGVGILGQLGHRPGQAPLDDVLEVHPFEHGAEAGPHGDPDVLECSAGPSYLAARAAVPALRPGGRRGRASHRPPRSGPPAGPGGSRLRNRAGLATMPARREVVQDGTEKTVDGRA